MPRDHVYDPGGGPADDGPGTDRRGTIVNVSSCSCEVVSLNRGEYCISKAGISMVTKLFAARLAPEEFWCLRCVLA